MERMRFAFNSTTKLRDRNSGSEDQQRLGDRRNHIVNSNTDTIALNAAQTYSDKFRSGPATITLTNSGGLHLVARNPGVQAKLTSNAFNFAGAVYGQSPFFQPSPGGLNYNTSGQNLAAREFRANQLPQNAIKQKPST